ncbi:hypothetical protein CI610_01267 [invertebrate metagenome]|uniref:Type III secretion system effector delivery regulator TyeA domain-containing protein n=1 Tax=invertebrate metagenome TaxID=1711999 RepID=A0A2H9T929_9ZZZZ
MDKQVIEGILLEQILSMIEQQWVTESDFAKIPGQMNVHGIEAEIFVMTRIVDIVRTIPEEVFSNDETKQALLAAAQECLDSKIEQEAEDELEDSTNMDYGYGVIGENTIHHSVSNSGQEDS